MGRDPRAILRRAGKLAELSLVLGLALGYAAFYAVYPSSSVPTSGDASFPWILAILIPVSLLVGLAAEDVPIAMEASILSIPAGLAVSTVMGLTPGLAGLYIVAPDEIPFFVAHYALAIFALAFVVNIAGTFVGFALRDPFLRWTYRRQAVAAGRK